MWDSLLYDQMPPGYEYANDGKGHNVAFFPHFPSHPCSHDPWLPFNVAGTLVNNLAFLVRCSFCTVGSRSVTIAAARWATAVLACVRSLFGTVIYSGCICCSVQLLCEL